MPSPSAPEASSQPRSRTRGFRLQAVPPLRPLRVGVLALSPDAGTALIEPLSRAALPVHPIRIHLDAADARGSESSLTVSLTRAILDEPLDGLVLVGAHEHDAEPSSPPQWRELTEILEYARGFIPSTLGLGAGAVVLARVLGLDLVPLDQELRGLLPQRSLRAEHSLLNGSSEVFFSTEARRLRITDASIDDAVAAGRVTPLARSRDAGVSIFESADRRYVAHLGRPERPPMRPSVEGRISAFYDSARESARAHAAAFFAAWVRQIYEVGRKGAEASLVAP